MKMLTLSGAAALCAVAGTTQGQCELGIPETVSNTIEYEWKVTAGPGYSVSISPSSPTTFARATVIADCEGFPGGSISCTSQGVLSAGSLALGCDPAWFDFDCFQDDPNDGASQISASCSIALDVGSSPQGLSQGTAEIRSSFWANMCYVNTFSTITQTGSNASWVVGPNSNFEVTTTIPMLTPPGGSPSGIVASPAPAGASLLKHSFDDNWEMYLAPAPEPGGLALGTAINTQSGHISNGLTPNGDMWDGQFSGPLAAGSYPINVHVLPGITNGRLDFDGDGRFNIYDIAPFQTWAENFDNSSQCPDPQGNCPTVEELARYDLSGNGELSASDSDIAVWFILAGLDAGVFGDLNADDVVDCADAALQPSLSYTTSISSEDDEYFAELDFDLDGTIDESDVRELYRVLRPSDIGTSNKLPGDADYLLPDGQVDGSDLSKFVELHLASDPAADVTTNNTNPGDSGYGEPDGVVTGSDLSFFVESWLSACP